MSSIFGLPLEKLDNLTSDETPLFSDITDEEEKSIFVGGKYNRLFTMTIFSKGFCYVNIDVTFLELCFNPFLDKPGILQFHDNILLIFGLNATHQTEHLLLLSTVYRLVSLLPPFIIVLCQIGFGLIQSGASKQESAGLPFFINFITFALSIISYWVFGYAVSQTEGNTVLGYHYWFSSGYDTQDNTKWLLGYALALTTANIALHGGLERCPLFCCAILTPVVAGVIHGCAVHWAWYSDGWLIEHSPFAHVKYQDYGGSGVIHVIGGASGLVLSIVLGPRYSQIRDRSAKVFYNDLVGHSVPLEMFGGYLLCICYVSINCSHVFQTCINCDPALEMGDAVINTLVASGSSCTFTVLIVLVFTKLFGRNKVHWPTSRFVVNGLHVGMVAVAAGCNVYHHWSAFIVGMTSSIGYFMWSLFLYNTNNDDPLGVTAVHLGGGIWGLICVGLFEKETGLAFGKDMKLSFMGIIWNLVCGLILAAFSAVVTGLSLAAPRFLNLIPLSHVQEIQGLDSICVHQEAYFSGTKVTPFNTDVIEDRECFGDESPGSTNVTRLTSPTAYSLTRAQQEMDDVPYMTEVSKTAVELPYIPSFYRSPSTEADRRVWFPNGSSVQDQVAPDSPLIDYHKAYQSFDDIEL